MKIKLSSALLLLLSFSSLAFGDEIDKKFKTARKYLNDNKITVTTNAEEIVSNDYIYVVGEGSPKKGSEKGQRRLTALTAAKVVAQRNLAEILGGVAVVSETTVKDSELASDAIKTAVAGVVKGAQVATQDWNASDETGLVVLKVKTKGSHSVASTMYEKLLKEPEIKKELDVPPYNPPAPAQEATPAQQDGGSYDGLIIDATEQNFQPALINRIFSTAGEVLYDPAKISQKVLIEQGCGEYTNNVDKAKAALTKRDVHHPLVIKASGIKTKSDLKVSDEDAAKIFAANQTTGFIPKAQVAFVLK